MTLATEYAVRHELGKLFGAEDRGRFLCVSCLGPLVRGALGTKYTKGQIERTLLAVSKSPGALKQKSLFRCDGCGKLATCLGAK